MEREKSSLRERVIGISVLAGMGLLGALLIVGEVKVQEDSIYPNRHRETLGAASSGWSAGCEVDAERVQSAYDHYRSELRGFTSIDTIWVRVQEEDLGPMWARIENYIARNGGTIRTWRDTWEAPWMGVRSTPEVMAHIAELPGTRLPDPKAYRQWRCDETAPQADHGLYVEYDVRVHSGSFFPK